MFQTFSVNVKRSVCRGESGKLSRQDRCGRGENQSNYAHIINEMLSDHSSTSKKVSLQWEEEKKPFSHMIMGSLRRWQKGLGNRWLSTKQSIREDRGASSPKFLSINRIAFRLARISVWKSFLMASCVRNGKKRSLIALKLDCFLTSLTLLRAKTH